MTGAAMAVVTTVGEDKSELDRKIPEETSSANLSLLDEDESVTVYGID